MHLPARLQSTTNHNNTLRTHWCFSKEQFFSRLNDLSYKRLFYQRGYTRGGDRPSSNAKHQVLLLSTHTIQFNHANLKRKTRLFHYQTLHTRLKIIQNTQGIVFYNVVAMSKNKNRKPTAEKCFTHLFGILGNLCFNARIILKIIRALRLFASVSDVHKGAKISHVTTCEVIFQCKQCFTKFYS